MALDLQPGSKIGNFILDSYVGSGSFGVVWRAHREGDDQPVAVKLLTGALAASEMNPLRADVEVLAAAAASRSKHVVKVLGGGTVPAPYIAMEFVQGEDLQTLLSAQGHFTIEQTIEVGLAISDALQALDQTGIIHRDIKPANVMIDQDGVIKLADFGIAKIVGYSTVTTAGHTAMTMAYAAPEIWDDHGDFGQPSHRSDLYAMGILLYQCLTGTPPFSGDMNVLYQAHTRRRPNLDVLPTRTPASLRILIQSCLAKRQEDRPRAARDCTNLLKRAAVELAEADGKPLDEPKRFGPWIKDRLHESVPWAWHCHDERSGNLATVEVYFSDSLSMGEKLSRLVDSNAGLAPFGAEKLLGTSRLLLFPDEAWHEAPPGEFQFWLAREDLEISRAALITEPLLRRAVRSTANLLSEAARRHVPLDLGHDNLQFRPDGSVYLRRPGLADDETDPTIMAFSLVLSLPTDQQARRILDSAKDWESLVQQIGESKEQTSSMAGLGTEVVALSPTDATVLAAAAAPAGRGAQEVSKAKNAAAVPGASSPSPEIHPAAQRPQLARKQLILALAGMGIVIVAVVILVIVRTGGKSQTDEAATARSLLSEYKAAEALPQLNKLIQREPSNAEYSYDRARARLLLGDLTGAAADADNAIALNPNSAEANYVRSTVYDWQADQPHALETVSKAIDLDPKNATYYAHRSRLYFEGDTSKEWADANKAAELEPNNPETHSALAFSYRADKRYADAETEFAKAISADSKDGLLYTDRASLYFASGDYDKAIKAINDDHGVIDANPLWSAEGHWAAGATYVRQTKYQDALRELSKASEIVPLAPAYFDWRGYCYYLMGNYDAATADLNKALELSPSYADPYYVRALVHKDQHQLDVALNDANKAISLEPANADYHETLAEVFLAMTNYPSAIAEATKAIGFDGNQSDAYNVRSLAKDNQGLYNDALADINKAIELDPKAAQFLANRGSVLIDLKNYQGALDDLNKAIASQPNTADFYNLRGVAYYGLDNYDAAIADYSRAIQNDGNNYQYFINRGYAEEASSRQADARADYQKARALASTPDEAKEAQAALDGLSR